MERHPLTDWEDGFPYELLAEAGIGFDSTLQEVRDVSFELMKKRLMTAEVRKAWDTLRSPRGRLVVDFFLLQEVEAVAAAGGGAQKRPRKPKE